METITKLSLCLAHGGSRFTNEPLLLLWQKYTEDTVKCFNSSPATIVKMSLHAIILNRWTSKVFTICRSKYWIIGHDLEVPETRSHLVKLTRWSPPMFWRIRTVHHPLLQPRGHRQGGWAVETSDVSLAPRDGRLHPRRRSRRYGLYDAGVSFRSGATWYHQICLYLCMV